LVTATAETRCPGPPTLFDHNEEFIPATYVVGLASLSAEPREARLFYVMISVSVFLAVLIDFFGGSTVKV
jgi:hypothetical protein